MDNLQPKPPQGNLVGIIVLSVASFLACMGIDLSSIVDTIEIYYLNETKHGQFMIVTAATGLADSLLFVVVPPIISFFGAKFNIIMSAALSLMILMKNSMNYRSARLVFRVLDDFIWLLMFPSQGYYLSKYSTERTVGRNAAIFWAFYSVSNLFANITVYIQQQVAGSNEEIPDLRKVFWVYFGVTILGIFVMFLLPGTKSETPQETPYRTIRFRFINAGMAFKNLFKMLFTANMLILGLTCFYMGMLSIFNDWVYEVSLLHTYDMEGRETFSRLSGIFVETGHIIASIMISFIRGTVEIWGWNPIMVLGFLLQLVGFLFVYLNLPNASPLLFTSDDALINSNEVLSVVASLLLGFGDACFNTQTIALLACYYQDDSVSAFSIYKFFQSIGMFATVFYIFQLGLYIQMGILIGLAIVGTTAYLFVDWRLSLEVDES